MFQEADKRQNKISKCCRKKANTKTRKLVQYVAVCWWFSHKHKKDFRAFTYLLQCSQILKSNK